MNISLIRHAKVNYKWKKWSNSFQYDEDCRLYDIAEIDRENIDPEKNLQGKCYVSTLKRSKDTAYLLFGERNYIELELLDEVPLSSAFNSKVPFPVWFWNIIARIQWYFGCKRQKEIRSETIKRAEKLCKFIVEKNEDCVMITHGFYLHTIIKTMKMNNFIIEGESTYYKNCDVIRAKH